METRIKTSLRSVTDKRITLLLPGGFIDSGAIEAGFLTALDETGLLENVDTIVACSVGSLNGVMAVLGRIDELRDFWFSLKPEDIFKRRSLITLGMSHAALVLSGFAEERKIRARITKPFWRMIRQFFEARELHADAFNDAVFVEKLRRSFDSPRVMHEVVASPRELVVMTTDFTYAREKVFSSHDISAEMLEEAVIASASIPAFFPPRYVGGSVLVDGAELRPEPLTLAFDSDCDLILAVRDKGKPSPKTEFKTLADVILRIFEVDQYERRMREWVIAEEKSKDVKLFRDLRSYWLRFSGEISKLVPEGMLPGEVAELKRELDKRFYTASFSFRYDRIKEVIAVAPTQSVSVHIPLYGLRADFSPIPELVSLGYEETLKVLQKQNLVQ